MKRKIVFIMACTLMIAGIALIVNSVFDFIDKTKSKTETTSVTETAEVAYFGDSAEIL